MACMMQKKLAIPKVNIYFGQFGKPWSNNKRFPGPCNIKSCKLEVAVLLFV